MNKRIKSIVLDRQETVEIAEFAHSEFLRLLMIEGAFDTDSLVFHGGTSLRIIHNSPRYSEDLDFMISNKIIPELTSVLPNVVQKVAVSMQLKHPDLSIIWKSKVKDDNKMIVGMMSIKSPLWHRDVKVKVECYPAHDMTNYISSKMDIDSSMDITVPTATLESIMGDKLVALAKRPYFKERDAYDVWWMTKKGVEPTLGCIERSCAVYGYEPQEIVSLLGGVHDRIGSVETLEKDLEKWLPPELYKHFYENDIFDKIRQCTIDVCHSISDM